MKALNKREIQFDYIFLDPPYNKGLIDKALEQIAEFNLLKEMVSSFVSLATMNKSTQMDSK